MSELHIPKDYRQRMTLVLDVVPRPKDARRAAWAEMSKGIKRDGKEEPWWFRAILWAWAIVTYIRFSLFIRGLPRK